MSLHYLLDGYNIVKKIPHLSDKNLEAARAGFYSLIETRRPQGSPRNKITIVFDGKSGVGPHLEHSSLEVIFTRDKSADDEIKEIIRKVKNRARLVLVSDDRHLRLDVRAMGARIISVDEFLNQGRRKLPNREEGKEIPFDVEYKVNLELRKLWLRPKK